MRQRLTALFIIAAVLGLVAVARPHAQLSRHASISAPQHHAELPPMLGATPRVVLATARVVAFRACNALSTTQRTHDVYLANNRLLL